MGIAIVYLCRRPPSCCWGSYTCLLQNFFYSNLSQKVFNRSIECKSDAFKSLNRVRRSFQSWNFLFTNLFDDDDDAMEIEQTVRWSVRHQLEKIQRKRKREKGEIALKRRPLRRPRRHRRRRYKPGEITRALSRIVRIDKHFGKNVSLSYGSFSLPHPSRSVSIADVYAQAKISFLCCYSS